MQTYLFGFLSVLVVSLVSFVGVFALSFKEEKLKKYIFILISVAIGALLGDAFIHIIPEALEHAGEEGSIFVSIFIIIGVILFFITEKFLHWHHHEDDTDERHIHPVGKLVIFSDSVHNLIDGIIIGASFLVSIPVGIATTIAVILHEIPQEVGDFAVLLHAGYSKKKALFLNFISAIFALLGTAIVFILGSVSEKIEFFLLPIAAGGFIYIALSDLIPELHKTKNAKHSLLQIVAILFGVCLMFLLTFIEAH